MTTSIEYVEKFSEFARAKLASCADLNLVDLAAQFQFEHDSESHFAEDVAAVQEALTAMDNGETGRPMSEFDAEFRKRNGIK